MASRLTQHKNALRVFAVCGLCLAAGGLLRALSAFVFPSETILSDIFWRMSYVLWPLAAVAAPVTAISFGTRGDAGLVGVSCALASLLLALFAFTPAFPSFPLEGHGGLSEALDIARMRWAYPALIGFTSALFTFGALNHLFAGRGKGPRYTRNLTLTMALAYGASGIIVIIAGLSDLGALGVQITVGTWSALAGLWLLSLHYTHLLLVGQTMRSSRQLQAKLESVAASALRDPLTGLFNRGFFVEALLQAIEHLRRGGEPFAVALMDLDDFKKVNDEYGHRAGDLVLQSVAKVVMRGLRPYDTVARYGGEEFVMILRGVDRVTAIRIIERLRTAVHDLVIPVAGGKNVTITATFGLVFVGEVALGVDEIFEAVDKAMYEGKRLGKNRVRVAM